MARGSEDRRRSFNSRSRVGSDPLFLAPTTGAVSFNLRSRVGSDLRFAR